MSESTRDCEMFEESIHGEASTPSGDQDWSRHVEECASCSEQFKAHRLLEAAFEGLEPPQLPADFERELSLRLRAAKTVRPLKGWRQAAMVAYTILSLLILAKLLERVDVVSIVLANSWLAIVLMTLVPLTFVLALVCARWLPERIRGSAIGLALSL